MKCTALWFSLLALFLGAPALAEEEWLGVIGEGAEESHPPMAMVRLYPRDLLNDWGRGFEGLTPTGFLQTVIGPLFGRKTFTLSARTAQRVVKNNHGIKMQAEAKTGFELLAAFLQSLDDRSRGMDATVRMKLGADDAQEVYGGLLLEPEVFELEMVPRGDHQYAMRLSRAYAGALQFKRKMEHKEPVNLARIDRLSGSDIWKNCILEPEGFTDVRVVVNEQRGLLSFVVPDGRGEELKKYLIQLQDGLRDMAMIKYYKEHPNAGRKLFQGK